jgi:hypothetical protein
MAWTFPGGASSLNFARTRCRSKGLGSAGGEGGCAAGERHSAAAPSGFHRAAHRGPVRPETQRRFRVRAAGGKESLRREARRLENVPQSVRSLPKNGGNRADRRDRSPMESPIPGMVPKRNRPCPFAASAVGQGGGPRQEVPAPVPAGDDSEAISAVKKSRGSATKRAIRPVLGRVWPPAPGVPKGRSRLPATLLPEGGSKRATPVSGR